MRDRENYRKYHSNYQRQRYQKRMRDVLREMGNRCHQCEGQWGLRFKRKTMGELHFPSFVLKAWQHDKAKDYIKRNYVIKCMFC